MVDIIHRVGLLLPLTKYTMLSQQMRVSPVGGQPIPLVQGVLDRSLSSDLVVMDLTLR